MRVAGRGGDIGRRGRDQSTLTAKGKSDVIRAFLAILLANKPKI
jgi:hypothetical protein